MSEQIERWTVHEQSEPNEFYILKNDEDWVIAFRFNGHFTRERQMPVIRKIEALPVLLEAVKAGVEMRRAQAAYFQNTTHENLAASKDAVRRFDDLAKLALEKAVGAVATDPDLPMA